jgi:WD40 repeat protein
VLLVGQAASLSLGDAGQAGSLSYVPKITDFGLAKLLTEGPSDGPTQSGVVVGTPGYMAPEQAAGKPLAIGPAADIYALGAILYECLTGRPPFHAATTLETLLQVMHDEPVSINSLQPRVPRDLATIAMRCLEKQPVKRYASALDLADDLGRFLAGQPIHARRVGPFERVGRWCKRNPVIAGLASSLLLALVLGITGVSWKWWEADQGRMEADQRRMEAEEQRRQVDLARKDTAKERDAAVSARKDTARERDRAVMARREEQRSRAGVLLDKGVALAEQGEVAQGLFWMLEGLVVAEESEDGPLQAVIRTNLAGWQSQAHALRQVHRGPGGVTCGTFSADGKRFALGYQGREGEKGKAQVYDSATGKPVGPLLEHEGDVHFVAFGPDGKTLVTSPGYGTRFLRWDLTTYRALGQPFAERKEIGGEALSPDGKLLAVGDKGGLVRLWDVERQSMVRSMAHDKEVKKVAFSSDGKTLRTFTTRLGVVGGDAPRPPSAVHSWDVATGRRIGHVNLPAGEEAFRFGPAGNTVLTLDQDSLARVRNGETGRIIGVPMALSRGLASACFAPDGRMLLLTDSTGACEWWDGALGQPVVGALPAGGAVLAFSPCGKFVLRQGALWEVARAKSRPLFRSPRKTSRGGWATKVAYSPDRRSALVGDNRGLVRLVSTATGRPRGVPLRVPWRLSALAFSPDGKRFAVASHDKPFGDGGSMGTVCYLCDSSTGRPICPPLPHVNWVSALSFSPDGKLLALGDWEGEVALMDRSTGREVRRMKLRRGPVVTLAFTPDGETLICESEYAGVQLFDPATGKEQSGSAIPRSCWHAACSPDGKTLALFGRENAIRLWDLKKGVEKSPTSGHVEEILSIAVTPDGKTVASGSWDGTVRLWEKSTGREVRRWVAHVGEPVNRVRFLPDGKTLVSAGWEKPLRLWDVATGRKGTQFEHSEVVFDLGLSGDGKTLFAAGWFTIEVFDLATKKRLYRLGKPPEDLEPGRAPRPLSHLAISPAGRTVGAMQGTRWRRWKLPGGEESRPTDRLMELTGPIVFSPDGKTLAARRLSWDKEADISFWETLTGEERLLLRLRTGGRRRASASSDGAAVFAPDGKRFASSREDEVRLWDARTGRLLRTFKGHRGDITSLAFSPDGASLISASRDTTALVWDLSDPRAETPAALSPAEVKKSWSALAADAAQAYRAIHLLADSPLTAVPFVAENLKPVRSPDPKMVGRWIADLDSSDFASREKASDQLSKHGNLVEVDLKRALQGRPTVEMKRRLRRLLAAIKRSEESPTGELLQALRAVEVLEHAGTPEARRVLRALARGAAEARLTREAKASLDRLMRRSSRP